MMVIFIKQLIFLAVKTNEGRAQGNMPSQVLETVGRSLYCIYLNLAYHEYLQGKQFLATEATPCSLNSISVLSFCLPGIKWQVFIQHQSCGGCCWNPAHISEVYLNSTQSLLGTQSLPAIIWCQAHIYSSGSGFLVRIGISPGWRQVPNGTK